MAELELELGAKHSHVSAVRGEIGSRDFFFFPLKGVVLGHFYAAGLLSFFDS